MNRFLEEFVLRIYTHCCTRNNNASKIRHSTKTDEVENIRIVIIAVKDTIILSVLNVQEADIAAACICIEHTLEHLSSFYNNALHLLIVKLILFEFRIVINCITKSAVHVFCYNRIRVFWQQVNDTKTIKSRTGNIRITR